MLKILANPEPDEESRLEWMRARDYPPIDDDMNYDDGGATAAQPVTAAAVRGRARANGIPASTRTRAPKATTSGARVWKADSATVSRTARTGKFTKTTRTTTSK
jgi:hypothetical protein